MRPTLFFLFVAIINLFGCSRDRNAVFFELSIEGEKYDMDEFSVDLNEERLFIYSERTEGDNLITLTLSLADFPRNATGIFDHSDSRTSSRSVTLMIVDGGTSVYSMSDWGQQTSQTRPIITISEHTDEYILGEFRATVHRSGGNEKSISGSFRINYDEE